MKNNRNWLGIDGAILVSHGEWADPEICYKGVYFNYYDIQEGLLHEYREEHPEDKDDAGFDEWLENNADSAECELMDAMFFWHENNRLQVKEKLQKSRSNILCEQENGDVYYFNFDADNDKLQAGYMTNIGFHQVLEVDYEYGQDIDYNLDNLYDALINEGLIELDE